jgi:hypothetical protein
VSWSCPSRGCCSNINRLGVISRHIGQSVTDPLAVGEPRSPKATGQPPHRSSRRPRLTTKSRPLATGSPGRGGGSKAMRGRFPSAPAYSGYRDSARRARRGARGVVDQPRARSRIRRSRRVRMLRKENLQRRPGRLTAVTAAASRSGVEYGLLAPQADPPVRTHRVVFADASTQDAHVFRVVATVIHDPSPPDELHPPISVIGNRQRRCRRSGRKALHRHLR